MERKLAEAAGNQTAVDTHAEVDTARAVLDNQAGLGNQAGLRSQAGLGNQAGVDIQVERGYQVEVVDPAELRQEAVRLVYRGVGGKPLLDSSLCSPFLVF